MRERRWWHTSVGYEVYLRSFADGDGDGVGDLSGLTSKLEHLQDLGVDLLWITPFYPSPFADFGYDVADYTDVHPLYGDLSQLDKLVVDAHERDIKVVVDIVPNHTSDQHRWFREAKKGWDNPFRDHYIWADPAPGGGPPNNWVGYFGGPAWTFDETSGQYYLHLFLPEQPDLNWANPAVRDAFDDILRFWLDRGVDGFRIDVAQALAKDSQLRSNPQIAPWDPSAPRWEQWDAFEHCHDVLQPETLEIFERWRQVVEPYDALLLGETYVLEADALASLLRGDGLHAGFWFQTMHIEWDQAQIRNAIDAPLKAVTDPSMLGWVAASHDEPRPPTRFGDGDASLGRARSLAFSTLLFGLPGLPVLYQGEELGLIDGVVKNDERADPVGADVSLSRDGCRTPMVWGAGPNFGFSEAESTWLPMGGRTEHDSAAWQRNQPNSWFARYRGLVAARRANPELADAPFVWLDDQPDGLLGYRRGDLVVVVNLSSSELAVHGVAGQLVFDTHRADRPGDAVDQASFGDGQALQPAQAVIVRTTADPTV